MVVSVVVGLFLIELGFLVKNYPDLIAGYKSMSDERKKRVNINGLSSHMRNSMIVMGRIIIAGSLLLSYRGWVELEYQATFSMSIITVGTLYMWIRNQSYVH